MPDRLLFWIRKSLLAINLWACRYWYSSVLVWTFQHSFIPPLFVPVFLFELVLLLLLPASYKELVCRGLHEYPWEVGTWQSYLCVSHCMHEEAVVCCSSTAQLANRSCRTVSCFRLNTEINEHLQWYAVVILTPALCSLPLLCIT